MDIYWELIHLTNQGRSLQENMFALLGKPGYEKEKEELEKDLNNFK